MSQAKKYAKALEASKPEFDNGEPTHFSGSEPKKVNTRPGGINSTGPKAAEAAAKSAAGKKK